MKIINDLFEAMEERRRRRNREAALIFGGGCLILIILGIIIMIVGAIFNAVETANVNSLYGEYANACQPMPAGADSADNMPDAVTPRKILLLGGDTQRRHSWHSQLPAQWQAENEDDVALIGCVEEEEILLETCEYIQNAGDPDQEFTVRIEREQYQTTVVLVNPQTARRIDSLTLTGSEPDPCPPDDEVTVSGDQRGEPIEWADFASWVETYVFD